MRIARTVYWLFAWMFILGVTVQVFLAGMVVVAREMGWNAHRDIGHFLAAPLLVMLICAYVGRLPTAMKGMTWLLVIAYLLQADVVIFMREAAPLVSAFHPVIALVDFTLGLALARRARGLLNQPGAESGLPSVEEPAARS